MHYIAVFIPILWLLFLSLLHNAVLATACIIWQILFLSFGYCSYLCYTILRQMYYMADFIPIIWLLFLLLLHKVAMAAKCIIWQILFLSIGYCSYPCYTELRLAAKYIILQILLLSFCFCSYPWYTMQHWVKNVLYCRFYSYPFVIVFSFVAQCSIGCHKYHSMVIAFTSVTRCYIGCQMYYTIDFIPILLLLFLPLLQDAALAAKCIIL